jgi:hypothetical protein
MKCNHLHTFDPGCSPKVLWCKACGALKMDGYEWILVKQNLRLIVEMGLCIKANCITEELIREYRKLTEKMTNG